MFEQSSKRWAWKFFRLNPGVANAGYRAINSLHFEKGYCLWGAELTPEYTPYDAGLGFCVSLHKGDFLGREALVKVKERGPQWKLCTFTLDSQSCRSRSYRWL